MVPQSRGLSTRWLLTAASVVLAALPPSRAALLRAPPHAPPAEGAPQRSVSTNVISSPMKGVNLGGWFVLESWIYPSWWANVTAGRVADGLGECQFIEILGQDVAAPILEQHWDTWVTYADIAALAAANVTHVRIPIGYWILGDRFLTASDPPYITGGWKYLQRALGWLKQVGVQAVIDMHGCPGSQNGHDNSGCTGAINWTQSNNINRTVNALTYLAANLTTLNAQPEYAGVVAGIEIMNEPWTTQVGGPITMDVLKAFVQRAVDAIRGTGFDGMIWFPDGWELDWSGWSNFLQPPWYNNILMDTHIYRCFGGFDTLTNWQQINASCAVDMPRLMNHNATPWIVVGEYSLCIPNSPSTPFTLDDTMFLRAWSEAQMQAYGCFGPAQSTVKGAFFWNFKTESAPVWSYLDGLSEGYIPNLSANRTQTAFDCNSI